MRPRALVLAAVLGALALSGCSHAAAKKVEHPVAKTWTLTLDGAPSHVLGADTSFVDVDGNTAIFTFTDHGHDSGKQIASLDLRTGKRRVIARTEFAGGEITELARVGREIVYVDTSDHGKLTPGASRWRVKVLSTQQVLATSGDQRVGLTPDLSTVDGFVVWDVYPARGHHVRAFGWKPGGKVVQRDALPGDDDECTPNTGHPELVTGCDHRNGWIAWIEDLGAGSVTPKPSPVYIEGDQGAKQKIGETTLEFGAGPFVFGDYVLWATEDAVKVTSLEHPTATVSIPVGRGFRPHWRFATADGRAGIVTQHGRTVTLRIIDPSQLHLTSS